MVRGLVVVCVLPLLVGCVSYGEYNRLKGELELAEQANRQLIDQYNRLLDRPLMGPSQRKSIRPPWPSLPLCVSSLKTRKAPALPKRISPMERRSRRAASAWVRACCSTQEWPA